MLHSLYSPCIFILAFFFALLLRDLAFSSEVVVHAGGLVAPNDLFDLPALNAAED